MITHPALLQANLLHGFFTREGGFSDGIFSTLNCGLGSGDDIETVRRNRTIVATRLGVDIDHLISGYQVHGTDVAVVRDKLSERPNVDGMVTDRPGFALGILTADCGPILLADTAAGVIGACHAGWKGALNGVALRTVEAMEKLGAKRELISVVLGPTISQANYEVGPEFPRPFIDAHAGNAQYFIPSQKAGHHMFDLPGFLIDQMKAFGIGSVAGVHLCTYADAKRFYSYRRATHRGEKDYGRLMSAIAMKA